MTILFYVFENSPSDLQFKTYSALTRIFAMRRHPGVL